MEEEDRYFQNSLDHILLFDQLPRLFYPGTEKALEYDDYALEMSKFLLPQVKQMPCFEGMFVLAPLMHSEDQMDVNLYVRELSQLAAYVKSKGHRHPGKILEAQVAVGQKHLACLNKFDRYPHRNEVLGRESTPDELEWLKKPEALDF